MSECIRCSKTFFDADDSIHSCTPCPKYAAGVKEGEIIQQKLNAELQGKYDELQASFAKVCCQYRQVHDFLNAIVWDGRRGLIENKELISGVEKLLRELEVQE